MRILIICTYYPPDSAISAVRPYMFAKYLSLRGHDVTVLRSGLINISAEDYYEKLDNVRVLSYFGDNSPAELYEHNKLIIEKAHNRRKLKYIPDSLRNIIKAIYRFCYSPIDFAKKNKNTEERLSLIKNTIDSLGTSQFDIIFSTFSELENAYAGEYARNKFNCKWVMDFRDPIAQRNGQLLWEYILCKKKQKKIIDSADLCTAVSDDLFRENGKREKKIVTIYNGYDATSSTEITSKLNGINCLNINENKLSLCYTGQLYGKRAEAWEFLIRAISFLIEKKEIDRRKINIYYAGSGSTEAKDIMKKYNIEDIIMDLGYLSKTDVEEVQLSTDVFLVLSWNTKYEKGVLTGKFYEGLRAKKPILSIVAGDMPNSELKRLNDSQGYGFCFETIDGKSVYELSKLLKKLYDEKIEKGELSYSLSESIYRRFDYKNITTSLENEFKRLVNDE